MSFPFMDVDDLRRMYPELCSSNPLHILVYIHLILEASSMPQQNVELVFDTKRTPAMVIQEFSVKSHKQIGDVYFNELEDLNPNTGMYIYTCHARMMKFSGMGKSRSKKNAKQIACYELIKSAVMMDRYKDFHIHAKTKEEALKILEQIKPPEDDPSGESLAPAQPVNWVGRLTEFCAQNKLPAADYSFDEHGPPNQRTYTACASVGGMKGNAEAKKKKDAKGLAAQKLMQLLEPVGQVDSLRKGTDRMAGNGGELGVDDDEEPIQGLLGLAGVDVSKAYLEQEPQKALVDVLKDTTRFQSNYTVSYRDLLQPSTRGRSQTLLTIQYSKALPAPIVHPDGSITPGKVDKDAPSSHNYVFCGDGTDSDSARDEAARAALVHLLPFKGPLNPAPPSSAPTQ
ncbi:rde-4 [Pristionchus pacificus]|uniref:Rde-4 n=1 Tax=Pristionchus pacificus TaxID=54126 RepID=A0A2A6BQJ7_PRIPA|nr:rde-4 [Pristionchus pacificus]|eukprot:PDM68063.1 rde-4 [Pristionchus pacificus]